MLPGCEQLNEAQAGARPALPQHHCFTSVVPLSRSTHDWFVKTLGIGALSKAANPIQGFWFGLHVHKQMFGFFLQ